MTDKNSNSNKSRKIWLAVGAIVLIIVLLFWLYSIGTFEDVIGVSNG